jgi:hypothetical protein
MNVLMGIIYGAMLAVLLPVLWTWWQQASSLTLAPPNVPPFLRWRLFAMAIGVLLSGIRDLYAAYGLPGGSWPWPPEQAK